MFILMFSKVFSRLSAPPNFALAHSTPHPTFGLTLGGFCFLRDFSLLSSEIDGILCVKEFPFFVYGLLSVVPIRFDVDSRDIE